MHRNSTLLFLITLLFLLPGCATKKMAKQAYELEMAGMYKEAAELYYRSALRKPKKIEYKSALRRAGFMYVDATSQDISQAYNQGDYQKVVYDFLIIEDFVNRVKRTGVDVQIDHSTRRLYENAQDQYLNDRYESGLKLLGESNYTEAKAVFDEIYNIRPDFKETKSYLNIATVEPIYQSGTRYFSERNYIAAYDEWSRVVAIDPRYKDTRQRMMDALNERYKEGTLLLMNQEFNAAAHALGDVYKINPSYLDVQKLFIEAQSEPLYRQASQNMRSGRCREAYMTYVRIEDISGGYKESGRLKTHALQCASYPVAIYSKTMPAHAADGSEFENAIMQFILDKQDPFVKIHLLPSLNSRIHRSFIRSQGGLNRAMLKELHDRQGIKAVMVINIAQYDKIQERTRIVEKTGIYREAYTTEQGEMTHRDRAVKYTEYSSANRVTLSLNYQLIATYNGEVLLSQRLNSTDRSDMHYAVFEGGDVKNLYPTTTRNGNHFIDERNYASLQKLLTAQKQLTPLEKLREKVFVDLSGTIADALVNFNPER